MSDLYDYNKNVTKAISQFQKSCDAGKISFELPFSSGLLDFIEETEKIKRILMPVAPSVNVPVFDSVKKISEILARTNSIMPNLSSPVMSETLLTINKYLQSFPIDSTSKILTSFISPVSESLSHWDSLAFNQTMQHAINVFEKHLQSQKTSNDESIDIPESFAQILSAVNDNLEIPEANADEIVHISQTNSKDFMSIIMLILAILQFVFGICADVSSSKLSEQQHENLMQQEQMQHEEQLRQDQIQHEEAMQQDQIQHNESLQQDQEQHEEIMREERKQTKVLQEIADNTPSCDVPESTYKSQ